MFFKNVDLPTCLGPVIKTALKLFAYSLNKVSIFKERVFHGRENKEFINRKFSSLLKRQTNYND